MIAQTIQITGCERITIEAPDKQERELLRELGEAIIITLRDARHSWELGLSVHDVRRLATALETALRGVESRNPER